MIIQPYEETKRFNAISLVVSNRRVRYEVKGRICQSMSLTSVSSIGLSYSADYKWIGYALVAGVIAFFSYRGQLNYLPDDLVYAALLFNGYSVIRFLLSRRNKLVIYGRGGDRIIINVDRRAYKTAREVLDYVEDMKLKLE